jgi:Holliday junction resolvasome RuvABC DNA-binding subunit
MAHPFTKMFEKALKKSTDAENLVFKEAERILKKGYSEAEVFAVLEKLQKSLIDEKDEAVIREALEELRGDEETF